VRCSTRSTTLNPRSTNRSKTVNMTDSRCSLPVALRFVCCKPSQRQITPSRERLSIVSYRKSLMRVNHSAQRAFVSAFVLSLRLSRKTLSVWRCASLVQSRDAGCSLSPFVRHERSARATALCRAVRQVVSAGCLGERGGFVKGRAAVAPCAQGAGIRFFFGGTGWIFGSLEWVFSLRRKEGGTLHPSVGSPFYFGGPIRLCVGSPPGACISIHSGFSKWSPAGTLD
jgi:hypothetical protein